MTPFWTVGSTAATVPSSVSLADADVTGRPALELAWRARPRHVASTRNDEKSATRASGCAFRHRRALLRDDPGEHAVAIRARATRGRAGAAPPLPRLRSCRSPGRGPRARRCVASRALSRSASSCFSSISAWVVASSDFLNSSVESSPALDSCRSRSSCDCERRQLQALDVGPAVEIDQLFSSASRFCACSLALMARSCVSLSTASRVCVDVERQDRLPGGQLRAGRFRIRSTRASTGLEMHLLDFRDDRPGRADGRVHGAALDDGGANPIAREAGETSAGSQRYATTASDSAVPPSARRAGAGGG